jgi:4-hydroxyphenylpyruvate dioxygenase
VGPDMHNPLGLDGFAFAEFTSPEPAVMAAQFEQFGFVAAARRADRGLTLYRQGRINLVLNAGEGRARAFACRTPSRPTMNWSTSGCPATVRMLNG